MSVGNEVRAGLRQASVRRLLTLLVVGIVAYMAVPQRAVAQTPADTAAVLFEVARQLEAEGERRVAQVLYERILQRYPATIAATQVQARLMGLRRVAEEGDGRIELLVWSTLYGMWLGVAVPAALDAEGPEAYGIGLLVGGPAGFLTARSFLRGRQITEGQARAITLGGSWGTWQGLGWRMVLDNDEYGNSAQGTFGAMILGGLTGIGVGTAIATSRSVRAIATDLTQSGALWGTWYGAATAGILDLDGDDDVLTAALIGGNVGLITMAVASRNIDMSRGRLRLINVAGLAGLLAGAGLDLLIQPESGRVALLIPTLTSAAGLLAGVAWTRDRVQGGGAPGGGDAMLEARDGKLAWSVPIPSPTLLRTADGRNREPGIRLMFVRATF